MRNLYALFVVVLFVACSQQVAQPTPTTESEVKLEPTATATQKWDVVVTEELPFGPISCVLDAEDDIRVCRQVVLTAQETLIMLDYADTFGNPLIGTCRIKVIGPNPKEGWEENCAIKTAEHPLEMKPAEFFPGGIYEAEQILLLVRRDGQDWETADMVDISSLIGIEE